MPAVAASATPAVAATGSPAVQVTFTDISGLDSAQAIRDEATLGILDATGGAFRPDSPVTRATFVRWLVKANNAVFADTPGRQIHLAHGSDATFVDVAPSNPDFKYIQGLADAGYVIGVNATHFAPGRSLTREQMVAIKAPLDQHSDVNPYDATFVGYTDAAKVSPPYRAAIGTDISCCTSKNIDRVYGSIKTFHPQEAVTREEAAVAVSEVGAGNYHRSLAALLGRTPPP